MAGVPEGAVPGGAAPAGIFNYLHVLALLYRLLSHLTHCNHVLHIDISTHLMHGNFKLVKVLEETQSSVLSAEDEPDSKRAAIAPPMAAPVAPAYPQPGAAYAPQ